MFRMIRTMPVFFKLTDEECQMIANVTTPISLSEGAILFDEGQEARRIYVVREGVIHIVQNQSGASKILAKLQAGEVFGEIGVFQKQVRLAAAMAGSPAVVLSLEGQSMMEIIEEHPHVADIFRTSMLKRFKADAKRVEESGQAERGALLPVFSVSGGVGRSLVAANLAVSMAKVTGKKTLVWDMDLMFGDQADFFGVSGSRSLANLAMEGEPTEEALECCIQQTDAGVDVLPSPAQPEHAELIHAEFVRKCLRLLQSKYDYIICDTSRAVDDITLSLFEEASVGIYVASPEKTGIRKARRWLVVMKKIGFDLEDTRMIFNLYRERDEETVAYLRRNLDVRVLESVPFEEKLVMGEGPASRLLVKDDIEGEVAQALDKISNQLLGFVADAQRRRSMNAN